MQPLIDLRSIIDSIHADQDEGELETALHQVANFVQVEQIDRDEEVASQTTEQITNIYCQVKSDQLKSLCVSIMASVAQQSQLLSNVTALEILCLALFELMLARSKRISDTARRSLDTIASKIASKQFTAARSAIIRKATNSISLVIQPTHTFEWHSLTNALKLLLEISKKGIKFWKIPESQELLAVLYKVKESNQQEMKQQENETEQKIINEKLNIDNKCEKYDDYEEETSEESEIRDFYINLQFLLSHLELKQVKCEQFIDSQFLHNIYGIDNDEELQKAKKEKDQMEFELKSERLSLIEQQNILQEQIKLEKKLNGMKTTELENAIKQKQQAEEQKRTIDEELNKKDEQISNLSKNLQKEEELRHEAEF
ncbi:MAG: hypothetical protein EZS28_011027 [Streblomastix strix]|uniref:TOG domain-containing protein n=1 Tax=Streblomastix strix TaxID=222440 RepID=A0A5J4WGM9_9EUKA|nr:MAG: hypothetical protein EZS28_011027 [Streblomastix strix]